MILPTTVLTTTFGFLSSANLQARPLSSKQVQLINRAEVWPIIDTSLLVHVDPSQGDHPAAPASWAVYFSCVAFGIWILVLCFPFSGALTSSSLRVSRSTQFSRSDSKPISYVNSALIHCDSPTSEFPLHSLTLHFQLPVMFLWLSTPYLPPVSQRPLAITGPGGSMVMVLPTSSSHPREHLAKSGDIFCFFQVGKVLLVSHGQKPEILLNIGKCSGQSPSHPLVIQNDNGAYIE